MLKIRRMIENPVIILTALAVLFIAASGISTADSVPTTVFENHYGGSASQSAYQVVQTSDRGFILVGTGPDANRTTTSLTLVKTDAISNPVWSKSVGGSSGYSVREIADGGFIATGAQGYSLYLVKTDNSGDKQWEKIYTNASGQNVGYSVQLTPDGGYVIAGQVQASTGNWEMYLLKTDASGNVQWESYYGNQDVDARTYSVWPTSDGGYVVGGYIKGSNNAKPLIIKTDAHGNIEWAKSYEGPGAQDSFLSTGYGVQQTSDGGYIYGGEHSSYTYLLKVDAGGNKQWDHDYRMTGAASVRQTWDGGYIAAGYYTDPTGIMAVCVVRTDADGNKLWDDIYRGMGYANASSVIQTGSGAFVVAGSTKSDKNSNSNFYMLEIGNDTSPVPNAKLVSDTIPAQMESGKAYNVQVTYQNDGTMPWTYQDGTTLGTSGDASKFGSFGTGMTIPSGTVIRPGQSETFSFTMTAPAQNGTYSPQFRMTRAGHGPFGDVYNKVISVVNTTSQASATAASSGSGIPCLSSILVPLLAVCIVAISVSKRKK